MEAREAAYRSLLADGRPTTRDRRLPHPVQSEASQPGATSAPSEAVAGSVPEAVSSIVEAAHWAPTPENWQAWRFHWTGECLEIFWDFESGTSFLDVNHCLAFMSIGGAVVNMEIAAAQEGLTLVVNLLAERRSNHPAGDPLDGLGQT